MAKRKQRKCNPMRPHETHIPRDLAAEYGHEAVRITRAGRYRTSSDRTVHIAAEVNDTIRNTHTYRPGEDPPIPETKPSSDSQSTERDSTFDVLNKTTLFAAYELHRNGRRPVSLNFASATHPGGGFLNGALAQEEYLCRSSALHAALERQPMYTEERQRNDPLYRDWVIYSPDVPVFRADDGTLLDEPWTTSFLTSPAPNAGRLPRNRHDEIATALRARIHKVLATGLAHGHDAIVLGAWGCGAFRCDTPTVAELFHQALHGPFLNTYRAVVFAILDWSNEKRFIGPFERVFPQAA